MKYKLIILASFCLLMASCYPSKNITPNSDDGKIDIQFLQINDVYEIAPIEGGKVGGMARVATVKKELLKDNANTYLVIAGDFLSPSVYNSLKYEGQRIRGRQMIDVMNAAGMNMAVFGNHEFDINESELQRRLNESTFQWISSNSFNQKSDLVKPFEKVNSNGTREEIPETYFMDVKDKDGTKARLGFIAVNIKSNSAPYVVYVDGLSAAVRLYNQVKDSCDAVIAITHQLMQDDISLARAIPQLAAIIGGHEHDMRYARIGNVVISKAHANARSAYVINVMINKSRKTVTATANLKMIDESTMLDSATNVVVQKWESIADNNYAAIGFDANKILLAKGEPLIARESVIRREPTNFSRLIVKAMEKASPYADIAIINTGAIRLDDVLYPPFTEYDILRTMPFGGGIPEAEMKGSVLKKILEAGRKNIGIGGYLVYSESVHYDTGKQIWLFKNMPVSDERIYRVALTDFLLTGGEENMNFLTKDNPDIIKIYPTPTVVTDPKSDIRLAIIRYMQQLKP